MYNDIIKIVIILLCMLFIWYFSKKDTIEFKEKKVEKINPKIDKIITNEIPKKEVYKRPVVIREKVNSFLPIEGIGPKINKLLHENGIKTFEQLSNSKIEDLQKILNDGGNSFNMANPATWSEQAKLANDKKWEELKQFQDNLHKIV